MHANAITNAMTNQCSPQIPHLHGISWYALRLLIKNLSDNYNEMVVCCLNSESNLYGHTPEYPRLGIRHWNLEDCLRCSSTDFSSLQQSGIDVFCHHFSIDKNSTEQIEWCRLWNCTIIQALVCVARTYSSFLLITNTTYDPRHFAFNLKETVYRCLGMESISAAPWHEIHAHLNVEHVYNAPEFVIALIKYNFATQTFKYPNRCNMDYLCVLDNWQIFHSKKCAFAMATHDKLGANSPAHHMTGDLIATIFQMLLRDTIQQK